MKRYIIYRGPEQIGIILAKNRGEAVFRAHRQYGTRIIVREE